MPQEKKKEFFYLQSTFTDPNVAILVIWFPVSPSVAVEEPIAGGPV